MVEALNTVLPIFVYILLIVLLVVGIILGIKLIITLDKINEIADDVKTKISAFDNLFKVVSGVSDKFSMITSRITDTVISLVNKIGNRRRKDEDYE